MNISVTKLFTFELGHSLEDCYDDSCRKAHGHSYRLEVTFENELNRDGMVMDFKMMKELVKPVVDSFDHTFITKETIGYNPTAENIALDIFQQLRESTNLIKKIKLWETATAFVEVSY